MMPKSHGTMLVEKIFKNFVILQLKSNAIYFQLEFQTYDPQKYAENAPVLRQLNVAPKSELKKFRDNERRRGANFEQQARKN